MVSRNLLVEETMSEITHFMRQIGNKRRLGFQLCGETWIRSKRDQKHRIHWRAIYNVQNENSTHLLIQLITYSISAYRLEILIAEVQQNNG